jgi:hypothetical protein
MSGTASAGTQQAGTIGTANDPVDVESEDISNADTVTTQDLVVNGTATGPFGSDLQGCRVFLSSDQSFSANSAPKIQFDSKVYDSGNDFDTSTHNYTCPKDGIYSANLQVGFEGGGSTEVREVSIGDATNQTPNSEGVNSRHRQTDAFEIFSASTMNKYSQGDVIAAYANNENNSDVVGSGDTADFSFLEVVFLGAL